MRSYRIPLLLRNRGEVHKPLVFLAQPVKVCATGIVRADQIPQNVSLSDDFKGSLGKTDSLDRNAAIGSCGFFGPSVSG
jgi:hypothetical protein